MFSRFFASAAKGKGPKQLLMSKLKRKTSFSSKKRLLKRTKVQDQSALLKDALFAVEPAKAEYSPTAEELERRSIIAKAWSRYCGVKDKAQKMQEYFFLLSKVRTMEELQKIDSELAERAKEISYAPPPLRRLPSIFPPTKLPFH